jgi:hypothetical protein
METTSNIQISGDSLSIHFNQFDIDSYDAFMKSKHLPEFDIDYDHETDSYTVNAHARYAYLFGIDHDQTDRGWLPISPHLFDYNQFITKIALRMKRYAVWADTGLGKTHILLEWARQVSHKTNGKVLIIQPGAIIPQTLQIDDRYFSLGITNLKSRAAMREWCATPLETESGGAVAIVNPEKFIPNFKRGDTEIVSEIRYCAGVAIDESSLLKSGGGRIKWSLIKSCKGIEYKLSLTATPAPNDTMEYASQGSFLEKIRSEGDVIWRFFVRDKFGNWKVKDHARAAFYRFLSGWSIYIRNPANYGFADNLKDIPKPKIEEIIIEPTREQLTYVQSIPDETGQLQLFGKLPTDKLQMTDRSKYSQIAKGFIYQDKERKHTARIPSRKPGVIADLVLNETRADRDVQILIWTVFDEESAIIAETLKTAPYGITAGVETLTGKIPKTRRADIIESFRLGNTKILISKASLIGFGLNFQFCTVQIFSGFDDSFERFYQAVRRSFRYGQKRQVRIYIPYIRELEGVVWANVKEKEGKFIHDVNVQERNYIEVMRNELEVFRNDTNITTGEA